MAINITPELATRLTILLGEADRQEEALAMKLNQYYFPNQELRKKLLQATAWTDAKGHNSNVKVIKQYYYFLTSGTGDWLVDAILNDTVEQLTNERQDIAAEIGADIGFQEVLRQFKTNTILKQFATHVDADPDEKGKYGAYAGGNKVEANTFANIIKNIIKQGLGKGIQISNTSPHEFKNSVLYDIEMSIDGFPFNMEVKAGIHDKYANSYFKFGTFSSTSLGGGVDYKGEHLHDDTYAKLLPLIGQTAKDLVKAIYKGNISEKVVEKFAVDSALTYLEWRIREAQYPIFVNEKQINTCSEIIKGLLEGKGYVDYQSYKVSFTNTRDAVTQYQTIPSIDFMNGEIREIQREALQQALRENRLTPQFRSTVWYGKQK